MAGMYGLPAVQFEADVGGSSVVSTERKEDFQCDGSCSRLGSNKRSRY